MDFDHRPCFIIHQFKKITKWSHRNNILHLYCFYYKCGVESANFSYSYYPWCEQTFIYKSLEDYFPHMHMGDRKSFLVF